MFNKLINFLFRSKPSCKQTAQAWHWVGNEPECVELVMLNDGYWFCASSNYREKFGSEFFETKTDLIEHEKILISRAKKQLQKSMTHDIKLRNEFKKREAWIKANS